MSPRAKSKDSRPPVLSKAAVIKARNDMLADRLRELCRQRGILEPVREWKFCDERRWRFDFAWPDALVALEQEGGVWTGGRHTRGKGYTNDLAKYNCATLHGWRVIRKTPDEIATDDTVTVIAALIKSARRGVR